MNIFAFLLLLTGVAAIDLPSAPPAVIWGASIEKQKNIFEAIRPRQFADMIIPLQAEYMIIAYFAPQLTSKDLTCNESDCFTYLRSVQPFTYYSQIYQPLDAIEYMFALRGANLEWTGTFEMSQLYCEKNQLIAYDFADNNLMDHDSFMFAVSETLPDCPVLQIYTAHSEEMEALTRRINRVNSIIKWEKSGNRMRLKDKPKPVKDRSENKTDAQVVLRDLKCIVALQKIVYAEQNKKGMKYYYTRHDIYLDEKKSTLRMQLRDSSNMKKGLNFTIDTTNGTFYLELSHMVGNWHITSLYFMNFTFLARDLLFYGDEFSFCSSSLTAYSSDGHRLTLLKLSMDLITDAALSALDPKYQPKPCWHFDGYLSPALAQALFTVIVLLACFGLGLTMFLEMGRNKRMAHINDPEPHLKVMS